MREHRFKTYDTKVKSFVCIDDYISDYRGSINDFFYNTLKIDRLVLLEDIGLKDRKRNPIYNGDILTLDGNERYQVKYIAPKYVLADSDGDMIFDSKAYFEEREIVGNIYETPELLSK